MTSIFEELDYQDTPLGEISLRRRSEPKLAGEVLYEVKLGEEFLMSSLFVEAEEQLSTLGLQALRQNGHQHDLDIVVGGLGLGYTALQVLKECDQLKSERGTANHSVANKSAAGSSLNSSAKNNALCSLRVIDVMQAVISWHQRGLLPIGDVLATDSRTQLQQGDFFAIATDPDRGFDQHVLDQQQPVRKVHAVLLDIDHSPSHWLNQENSHFYTVTALRQMAEKIHTGGVFGLWSNELPDPAFVELLDQVFVNTQTQVVNFANPYQNIDSSNSVYIATVR